MKRKLIGVCAIGNRRTVYIAKKVNCNKGETWFEKTTNNLRLYTKIEFLKAYMN